MALTVTHRASVPSTTDASTYSGGVFSGISLGANTGGCLVVVHVAGQANSGRTVNSGTIGGSAASLIATTLNLVALGILYLRVGAGVTTVNIAFTFSNTVSRAVAHVFTIEGSLLSDTPFDSDFTQSTAATSLSRSLDIPDQGTVIASAGLLSATDNAMTWTGAGEVDERHIETNLNATAAMSSGLAAETGRTISCAWTNSDDSALICASWGESGGGGSIAVPVAIHHQRNHNRAV